MYSMPAGSAMLVNIRLAAVLQMQQLLQLACVMCNDSLHLHVLLCHVPLQAGLKMQDVHYSTYPVDNYSELRNTLHALLEGSQVRQQQRKQVQQYDKAMQKQQQHSAVACSS
jgi:hypothetical protein